MDNCSSVSNDRLAPRLLTVAMAAERLGVPPTTVHEMIAVRELLAYHLGSRVVRVDRRDVERLAKKLRA